MIDWPKDQEDSKSARVSLSRRQLIRAFIAAGALAFGRQVTKPSLADEPEQRLKIDMDKALGLLLGGMLGDALGGPFEFSQSPLKNELLCNARSWADDDRLTAERIKTLAESLPQVGYEQLRPDTAPYGQWTPDSKLGTITDDSRHKLILIDAIRRAAVEGRVVSNKDLAKAFLEFRPAKPPCPALSEQNWNRLIDEGLAEYRLAANWVLGERDLKIARPVERLWAGVPNCSGQMLMPPLAVLFPGRPSEAYRLAYEINFVDNPLAKDITAALVAGLASVLPMEKAALSKQSRWKELLTTMRQVDPFMIGKVPFAGRPLLDWMDRAAGFARRAGGSPQRLFHILETDGKPTYWWDAHFTLLVPLACLHLCRFDAAAAMHLCLDFGHDTDSYAQVLGCMWGAVEGKDALPDKIREAVVERLAIDYQTSPQDWIKTLVPKSN